MRDTKDPDPDPREDPIAEDPKENSITEDCKQDPLNGRS